MYSYHLSTSTIISSGLGQSKRTDEASPEDPVPLETVPRDLTSLSSTAVCLDMPEQEVIL